MKETTSLYVVLLNTYLIVADARSYSVVYGISEKLKTFISKITVHQLPASKISIEIELVVLEISRNRQIKKCEL